jgi:hypothetical protein
MPRPLIMVVWESVSTSVSREVQVIAGKYALRQIFQIDLMADADARRNDPKRPERLHAPLQKLIAFPVALKLQLHVERQRIGRRAIATQPVAAQGRQVSFAPGEIHLHGMVNDQIHGHERLDERRVAAQAFERRAHGGQIAQQRHAGEILKQYPRNDEGNLRRPLSRRCPLRQAAYIVFGDAFSVAVAQDRFQHDAQ